MTGSPDTTAPPEGPGARRTRPGERRFGSVGSASGLILAAHAEGEANDNGRIMYTLYAVWSAPAEGDIQAFEEHYTGTHAPLASAVPNLRRFLTTRTSHGLAGGDPAFYRVAEMSFDSREALEEAEATEQWAKVRADAGVMIERFGVTMSVAMGDTDQDDGGTL